MLDKTKTNNELGVKINQYLKEKRVQTPTQIKIPEGDNLKNIENSFTEIMKNIGLDLTDDSLIDTPKRMAKMFLNELFWGLKEENFPKITTVENKMNYDEMVLERDIKVCSVCEHHFVTIWGKAHVAYIPNNKVLGLSKLNRVVEYFCKRPQIQERLGEQIYYALQYVLETEDIAVVIDAEHFCVKSRGVEDIGSSTVTSKLGGKFKDIPQLRAEFLSLIRK